MQVSIKPIVKAVQVEKLDLFTIFTVFDGAPLKFMKVNCNGHYQTGVPHQEFCVCLNDGRLCNIDKKNDVYPIGKMEIKL